MNSAGAWLNPPFGAYPMRGSGPSRGRFLPNANSAGRVCRMRTAGAFSHINHWASILDMSRYGDEG